MSLPAGALELWTAALADFRIAIRDAVKEELRAAFIRPDGVAAEGLLGQIAMRGGPLVPLLARSPAVASPFSLPVPAATDGTCDGIWILANTAPTSSALTLRLNKNGVDWLGSTISLPAEAVRQFFGPPFIPDPAVRRGDVFTVDVVSLGSGARDVLVAVLTVSGVLRPVRDAGR